MLTMECLNGDIFAKLDKNDAAPWFDVLNYHVLLFDVSMPLISRIKIIGAPLRLLGHILNDWSRDKRKITVSWKKSQILMIIYYFVYLYVKCLKHMLWMEGLYKKKKRKGSTWPFLYFYGNLTFKDIYLFTGGGRSMSRKGGGAGGKEEAGFTGQALWHGAQCQDPVNITWTEGRLLTHWTTEVLLESWLYYFFF